MTIRPEHRRRAIELARALRSGSVSINAALKHSGTSAGFLSEVLRSEANQLRADAATADQLAADVRHTA